MIITNERAAQIRGELTALHGATWMHHYHTAIEQAIMAEITPTPAQAYQQRKANVLKEKTMHAQIRAQYEADPTLTIECRNTNPADGYIGWTITTNPGWLPTFEYRIKGA